MPHPARTLPLLALFLLAPVAAAPALAADRAPYLIADVDVFEPEEECIVVGKNVNVRAEPSSSGKLVAKLNEPRLVVVKAVGGAQSIGKWGLHSWYLIEWMTKRGTFTGWIFSAFLSTTRGC